MFIFQLLSYLHRNLYLSFAWRMEARPPPLLFISWLLGFMEFNFGWEQESFPVFIPA